MDRHRLDNAHHVTPRLYCCPGCRISLRMLIEWPFWRCPACRSRLIPADLLPAEAKPQAGPAERPPALGIAATRLTTD
jgi:ribosomal protein L37AE/L43A